MLSEPRSALTRSFEQEINETQEWFDSPRFAGIVRPYTARQVVEQRGTIRHDYTIAREAAAAFYDRLRELFAELEKHGVKLQIFKAGEVTLAGVQ